MEKEFNYYVTLDNSKCSLGVKTNANYEEAYCIFAKWFLWERYTEIYDDLTAFSSANGYETSENKHVGEDAIHIDFNRIKFD